MSETYIHIRQKQYEDMFNRKIPDTCSCHLCFISVYVIWSFFLFISYRDLDNKSSYMTRLLFLNLTTVSLAALYRLIRFIYRLYGVLNIKRNIRNCLTIADVYIDIITIISIFYYIPFTTANCHNYDKTLCITMRICALSGIFTLFYYCLVLIGITYIKFYKEHSLHIKRYLFLTSYFRMSYMVEQYLIAFLSKQECTVCFKNDINKERITLPCDHSYHLHCIENKSECIICSEIIEYEVDI